MRYSVIIFFMACCSLCFSQTTDDYTELTDTKPHDDAAVWNKLPATPQISWGSTDIRYTKLDVPVLTKSGIAKAWKG